MYGVEYTSVLPQHRLSVNAPTSVGHTLTRPQRPSEARNQGYDTAEAPTVKKTETERGWKAEDNLSANMKSLII